MDAVGIGVFWSIGGCFIAFSLGRDLSRENAMNACYAMTESLPGALLSALQVLALMAIVLCMTIATKAWWRQY